MVAAPSPVGGPPRPRQEPRDGPPRTGPREDREDPRRYVRQQAPSRVASKGWSARPGMTSSATGLPQGP
eukprot:1980491-Pyramimonas_sp.AAC.1